MSKSSIKRWHMLSQSMPKSSNELIKILLENRGISTSKEIKEFVNPTLPGQISNKDLGLDPKNIQKAISLIKSHMKSDNQIAIYGDYDVDGVCSTAILWETLYANYKKVFPHIPHREIEGYGLSETGIDLCIEQGAKLIIALDNGVVAHKQVEYCNKNGIDVIILDHHEEGETYPEASVILHSKKTCAGALAWGFAKEFNPEVPESLLELVAISIISDMIPLTGINRSLVKSGLEMLQHTKRPGILALLQEASIDPSKVGTYEVGFVLGPRINAMGRLEHAIDSLRLICTRDPEKAQTLAKTLGNTNRSRQEITQSAINHAISSIEQKYGDKIPKLLMVHDRSYHQGIIGLIASKLVERYYRPAIALSVGDDVTKASARSVTGFDITQHIRSSSDLLVSVGGHSMAAGFSLETVNLENLTKSLVELAESNITDALLERVIKIDCEILPNMIDMSLLQEIERLQPFGLGNPEPLFLCKGLVVDDAKAIGKEGKHLKLNLSGLRAIAFGLGEYYETLTPYQKVDVIFHIIKDTYNGNEKLQLRVRDIKNHGT